MTDGYCSECDDFTSLVLDHREREVMCSECGFILHKDPGGEGPLLLPNTNTNSDTNSDVNTNTNTSDANADTNTIGGSSSSNANSEKKSGASSLQRAYETIGSMCELLGLEEPISKRAKELYKIADEKKITRGRSGNSVMSGCLYVASQLEAFPRTLKEISTVVSGPKLKEIYRVVVALKREVVDETNRTIHAKDLARRFCANMGLDQKDTNAVLDTLEKTEELDIRRTSTSILAAAVYMVTQLSEKEMNPKDIANAAEVAEATLRKTYKDIFPYASNLIPSWYAKPADMKKLSPP